MFNRLQRMEVPSCYFTSLSHDMKKFCSRASFEEFHEFVVLHGVVQSYQWHYSQIIAV